jgi:error-prone DNA polymerase
LNVVHGLTQLAGWRIEEARAVKDFSDLNDLALRASLSATALHA